MKPTPFRLALCLLATAALPTFSARALDPSIFDDNAPLTPALTQLFTDLEAIPAGATVTTDQHAALVADLLALPPGPSTPGAADVDQLATDLGTAAAAGLIDDDEEYTIASDVLVDPTDPDSWFVYLRDEVTYLIASPDPTDPGDGTLPGDGFPWIGIAYPYEILDLTAAAPSSPDEIDASSIAPFSARYYKVAGETAAGYSGEVQLTSVRHPGLSPTTLIRVSTLGLPLAQRYQVIVTRSTDGAKIALGKFRVHGTGKITEQSNAQAVRKTSSRVIFGQGLRPLSTRLKVNKISNVTVLDEAGRVRLSQDFDAANTSGTSVRRMSLTLQGGTSTASGVATAVFKSQAGATVRNHLRFTARNLPAQTTLTLLADGVPVGRYTTNAHGHLRLSTGSSAGATTADFSRIKTLSLTDAQGTVLLSGSL